MKEVVREMELVNALSLLIFDVIITYLFATYVVRTFEIGQKAMLGYINQEGEDVYQSLSFIERIGCIVIHGSLMTKCMLAVTLPTTAYLAYTLGYSMEQMLYLVLLVMRQHGVL